MTSLLGLDTEDAEDKKRASKALHQVEYWLGFYQGGVQALDKAPRAADYRNTMSKVRKQAFAFLATVTGLNQWMRDTLEVRNAKLSELELALGGLVDAAKTALDEIPDEDSRGKPKNVALRTVIGGIRRVFLLHYSGGSATRRKSGAVSDLSEQEADETEFVAMALEDAGIRYPKNLRSLFDESAAELLRDRPQVIEKIARKVDKSSTVTKKKPRRSTKQ